MLNFKLILLIKLILFVGGERILKWNPEGCKKGRVRERKSNVGQQRKQEEKG